MGSLYIGVKYMYIDVDGVFEGGVYRIFVVIFNFFNELRSKIFG